MKNYKYSKNEYIATKKIQELKKKLKHKHGVRWHRHDDGGQAFDLVTALTREITASTILTDKTILKYLKDVALNKNIKIEALIKEYSIKKGYQVNLIDVYQNIFKHYWPDYEIFSDFIDNWSEMFTYKLTPYRSSGLMSGTNIENKYFLKSFFENMGLQDVNIDNIVIKPGGFKSIYAGILLALTTTGVGEDRVITNNNLLMRVPFYASIIKFPAVINTNVFTTSDFSIQNLKKIINDNNIGCIYYSVVGNPDGKILKKEELVDFCQLIIEENKLIFEQNSKILGKTFETIDDYLTAIDNYNAENTNTLTSFIWVISDEVYMKSNYHKDMPTISTASIGFNQKSENIIDKELSNMYTYTITCVSPSKTFGYATSRIGICTTKLNYIIKKMNTAYKELLIREVNPIAEVSSIVQLCLTNDEQIKKYNMLYEENIRHVKLMIDTINTEMKHIRITTSNPDGGWFCTINIDISKLKKYFKSSLDLSVYFMAYANFYGGTGTIMNPGLIYGYESECDDNNIFSLRITVSKSDSDIDRFITDIGSACSKLDLLCGIITGDIMKVNSDYLTDYHFTNELLNQYFDNQITLKELAEKELVNILNN